MYSYSLTQWILFFFCYCFMGWIWECLYVSVNRAWKNKKWEFVNRGFLHGPMIPIYGFAAITILVATIRVRENTMVVYFVGAFAATIFELITGTTMERLFKVKYWDYSELPLNYHGHICLFVSMFWGVFSVLLVQVIHVPVENCLLSTSALSCEIVAFVLTAGFVCDATVSFNEAMDLREIIEALSENNETVKRLERRFDAVVAFTPIPDIDDLKELRASAKTRMAHNVEKLRWKNEEYLNRIKDYLQIPELEGLPDRKELIEKLEGHRKRLVEKSNKQFLCAMKQLKRNPGIKSVKHQESIEMLKELLRK